MKASCLQDNFSKALSIAGRAVATRPTLPVTQNVLISTEDNHLRISATNLEISMTTYLPAMVFEEGSITVPARLLTEFINSLRSDRVDLTIEPGSTQLNVTSGQSEANITGTPTNEFPPIPAIEDPLTVILDPATMRNTISRTAFAAATEESRPVLTGVELKLNENQYTMSAADGFRLAVQHCDLGTAVDETISLVVPSRSFMELQRLLSDHGESLEMQISQKRGHVMFKAQGKETVQMTSLLIQGTFPDTAQLIPQNHSTRAILDAPAALRAVRTAAIFARDSSNIIRLEINTAEEAQKEHPTIRVSAISDQLGDEQEEMGLVDIEGDASKIAFNSRYLVDILSVLDKGQLALETTSSSSPGVFKPTDNDDYVHVVMPMFVQW